jgi:hypothetical protein
MSCLVELLKIFLRLNLINLIYRRVYDTLLDML